ncbi:beta-ketoacyl-[acyl-carrier-protein] synthase family protein [Paenibacillus sp. ClWae2A]|uniref:beta-ketoacyl-[acyl-carrier-protein] synthase family protein n=1 Tax=Paenibacillus sp. ClWae2A TaxID=3057177 RepID=UPI0028F596C7|nr:beta-ketoacyl-[acyl-carrier-protein] synthase family protein [Paenibacillus sp. ClWae2A]MDT9721988.1 beta-ketoacyl-[acyl-carrier-protein] synthase family protein [Paenibacillus sp. ClWae2A]
MTDRENTNTKDRIVITGMGVLCALGDHPQMVYERMFGAETGIREVTRFNTDKLQSSLAGQLEDSIREAALSGTAELSMDLCARYAIAAAKKALIDSGLSIAHTDNLKQHDSANETGGQPTVAPARIGLTLGTCNGGVLSLEEQWNLSELDVDHTSRYPFYQQGDDAAQVLGVEGPVATLNTACAASGNAIGYASDLIRWGYADVMLAGGSDPLSHSVYAGFNVLRALNSRPSSPFSTQYGLNLGEGAAFVVLERLDAALERGATIYAELCAYGLSNDAHHMTASHPEGAGIQRAVEMAISLAGVSKTDIEYVNAHGTGTQANDRAEISGLRGSFGPNMTTPVSSSKAYFGHTLGTSAALELVTSLYAIRQGYVPATLHFEEPREGCEEVDIIQHSMRPMRPKYMICNNSGFGGHNVSLVLRTNGIEEERYSGVQNPERENSLEGHQGKTVPRRRVVITGVGAVSKGDILMGNVLTAFGKDADQMTTTSLFSLKDYDKSKYERRMNQLTQNTIGAVLAAVEDAAMSESQREYTGFIYGTARGSTSSISNFLESVFVKGPEYASTIYFPHTVINSIAGQTAEKLQFKGFNSSFSTGGNEGLTAALYATGKIREGALTSCLIGAGDERSQLAEDIDRAKGLHDSRYDMTEGSVCMVLSDLEEAIQSRSGIYAELRGLGAASGTTQDTAKLGEALIRAVTDALHEAGTDMGQMDLILLNSVGRPGELELEQSAISSMWKGEAAQSVPIITLNACAGYGESYSSMLHLAAAAELVSPGAMNECAKGTYAHLGLPERSSAYRHILTISSTVNRSYSAAVISSVAE